MKVNDLCMDDYRDAIYREVDEMVRPILRSNAKQFAYQLRMTHAEAMQEARVGLMMALRKYDYNDSRGGIFNFAKTAVHRHFLKVLSSHKAQARQPHVQVVREGKKVALLLPFVADTRRNLDDGAKSDFMDTFEAPVSAPDASLLEADAEARACAFHAALENSLDEREREVLRCKYDPPRDLRMLMLDELAEEPTIPLIGRYLGLSKNEVDWAIKCIRTKALEIIGRDFSELTDLSIVRAYVGRQ